MFSSPPICVRRAARLSAAKPQLGRHPAPGPGHLSLAASLFHPWSVPCASTFLVHLRRLQRVPRSLSPVSPSILPHWGRLPGTVPGRPSVTGGSSVWPSNPPAFLGKRILFMETCSSRSCPTNKGIKASTISLSSCAYEAMASGETTVKRTRHGFKTMVKFFQTGARRLHSKSASHIRLILSARILAFCSLSLVGSWISPSLAAQIHEATWCPTSRSASFPLGSWSCSGVGQ